MYVEAIIGRVVGGELCVGKGKGDCFEELKMDVGSGELAGVNSEFELDV